MSATDLSSQLRQEGPSTFIYMTRHPVTDLNANGYVQGRRSDSRLSKEGRIQAEKLSVELQKYHIDVVLSSPMKRCMEGIGPYVKATGVPTRTVSGLRERDYGIFDGKAAGEFAKWKREHKLEGNFDYRPPEGESFRDLRSRVDKALRRILSEYKGKSIAIMGHSSTDVALLLSLLGQKEEHYDKYKLNNASLTIVEIRDGIVYIKMFNSTEHLERLPSKDKSRSRLRS